MAMAMVVVSLLILLNTAGLDAVLVQDREIDEQMTRQIFGVVIVINVLFFLLLFLSADAVAAFYIFIKC